MTTMSASAAATAVFGLLALLTVPVFARRQGETQNAPFMNGEVYGGSGSGLGSGTSIATDGGEGSGFGLGSGSSIAMDGGGPGIPGYERTQTLHGSGATSLSKVRYPSSPLPPIPTWSTVRVAAGSESGSTQASVRGSHHDFSSS